MLSRDFDSQETAGGPKLRGKGQWAGTRLRDHDVLKSRYYVVRRLHDLIHLCF